MAIMAPPAHADPAPSRYHRCEMCNWGTTSEDAFVDHIMGTNRCLQVIGHPANVLTTADLPATGTPGIEWGGR